jgi:NAD(P)-dependent dehydrogenase (short-subunit alcohol dehydrogenase family)
MTTSSIVGTTENSTSIHVAAAGTAGDLDGMHVVLTGAGGGIGASIAHALAAQGARLTLMGRRLEPLQTLHDALDDARGAKPGDSAAVAGAAQERVAERASSTHHGSVSVDVTDADSVTHAFAHARAQRGPIAILVNNAGAAESAPFGKTSIEMWQRMLAVNLTGTFLCTQAALPDMLALGKGRIVNIASTAGLKGYAYVAAYAAAKHGVIGLTRSLALEVARKGITVNAVCPGYTETELLRDSIARVVAKTGRSEQEARDEFAASNPQRRLVQPEEVAHAVSWLCSAGAASITGQAISVSGGEVM